jgi:antibiotic biosynthesis monooxygenase (ABM) superfamily enzyme
MVVVIMKWDILPDKVKEYTDWAKSAVQRQLAVPGVNEFRAYRPVSGTHQALVTYEFDNFATWETWRNSEEVQNVLDEWSTLTTNRYIELWGPSPVVPDPIRPGG